MNATATKPPATADGRPKKTRKKLRPLAVDAASLGELLTVSTRTIRTWDGAGYIPAPQRIGGKVVWSVPEIREWIAAGSPDRATWNAIKAGNEKSPGPRVRLADCR